MRISDWSSDVCSSDLGEIAPDLIARRLAPHHPDEVEQQPEGDRQLLARHAAVVDVVDGVAELLLQLLPRIIGAILPVIVDRARDHAHVQRLGLLRLAIDVESEALVGAVGQPLRSEEHTSELQSLMRISYAVSCLKKKRHK